jgi:8-oxo-dGTP diphosphatase
MPEHRQKVMVYITNNDRLLIFAHPDHPAAGLQVPAGTLKRDEDPVAGAFREGFEETGIEGLEFVAVLGEIEFDARPFGRDEIHHRTYVHLRCNADTPGEWMHWEEDPSDAPGERVRFHLFWVPLDAVPPLSAGHDALLAVIRPEGTQSGHL